MHSRALIAALSLLLVAVSSVSAQAAPLGQSIQGRTFQEVHDLDRAVIEWFTGNVRGVRKAVVPPDVTAGQGSALPFDDSTRAMKARASISRNGGAKAAAGAAKDCIGRSEDACFMAADVVLVIRPFRRRGEGGRFRAGYVIFTKYGDTIHLTTWYVGFEVSAEGITVTDVIAAMS